MTQEAAWAVIKLASESMAGKAEGGAETRCHWAPAGAGGRCEARAAAAEAETGGRAPEETPVRVGPLGAAPEEDPLCMSIGAQIDLLELQMSAIAAENAALEENLLPTPLNTPGPAPPCVEEEEAEEVGKDTPQWRCLQQECQDLRKQLSDAKSEARQELAAQASRFEEEGQRRVQQVQGLCEQLRLQVTASEEEAWRQARSEVEEARRHERLLQDECWELNLQLASALEQLKCRELQAQLAAAPPTGGAAGAAPPPAGRPELAPEHCAELEEARREAAKWRRMVLEEQERNGELQERLLEAIRAEREARKAEREARKAAAPPDEPGAISRLNSM